MKWLEFSLAWPNSKLSPNSRPHFMELARVKKKYRKDSHLRCLAHGINRLHGIKAIHFNVTFHPPDNRRRDRDNMISSIKSGLDGVADCIGVDDSLWEFSFDKGNVVKNGKVHISLTLYKKSGPLEIT